MARKTGASLPSFDILLRFVFLTILPIFHRFFRMKSSQKCPARNSKGSRRNSTQNYSDRSSRSTPTCSPPHSSQAASICRLSRPANSDKPPFIITKPSSRPSLKDDPRTRIGNQVALRQAKLFVPSNSNTATIHRKTTATHSLPPHYGRSVPKTRTMASSHKSKLPDDAQTRPNLTTTAVAVTSRTTDESDVLRRRRKWDRQTHIVLCATDRANASASQSQSQPSQSSKSDTITSEPVSFWTVSSTPTPPEPGFSAQGLVTVPSADSRINIPIAGGETTPRNSVDHNAIPMSLNTARQTEASAGSESSSCGLLRVASTSTPASSFSSAYSIPNLAATGANNAFESAPDCTIPSLTPENHTEAFHAPRFNHEQAPMQSPSGVRRSLRRIVIPPFAEPPPKSDFAKDKILMELKALREQRMVQNQTQSRLVVGHKEGE